MTAKSFLLSTIGLLLLLWVYKIFMISYFDLGGWVIPIVYALGIIVLTMSMVRREGSLYLRHRRIGRNGDRRDYGEKSTR
jgi:hypothetical protein